MVVEGFVQERELALADVMEMTRVEGDTWKLSHVWRMLKLIELIGEGLVYDETAVTIAIYLHN